MGWSPERVARTVRLSVGEGNDAAQMARAATILVRVIERLRALARR